MIDYTVFGFTMVLLLAGVALACASANRYGDDRTGDVDARPPLPPSAAGAHSAFPASLPPGRVVQFAARRHRRPPRGAPTRRARQGTGAGKHSGLSVITER